MGWLHTHSDGESKSTLVDLAPGTLVSAELSVKLVSALVEGKAEVSKDPHMKNDSPIKNDLTGDPSEYPPGKESAEK